MYVNAIVTKMNAIPFRTHLVISVLVRLVLIVYGEVQDAMSEVPYTDVDYKVVTDGARHVLNGGSPFDRHTYRYTPMLAYLAVPNLIVHKCFGKLLFSMFDILVGIFIRKIIVNDFYTTFVIMRTAIARQIGAGAQRSIDRIVFPKKYEKIAEQSALIWLYNPLTMVIATRGNGDSITSLLVLISVYFLQRPNRNITNTMVAGISHGLAIHFRIYPIIFSLPFYLVLGPQKNLIRSILMPNRLQVGLVFGTIITLVITTAVFYDLYGFTFLYETYIYHVVRNDIRHNFSLYFYMMYLNAEGPVTVVEKCLAAAPQLIILVLLAMKFGRNSRSLSFCIFTQAFIMVTYNTVITSQYFVWFLSLFPLCAKNLKKVGLRSGVVYGVIWFLSQAGWLLPAYFLEFKGWNTFEFIWLQGILFFSANIYILQRLIFNFDVSLLKQH